MSTNANYDGIFIMGPTGTGKSQLAIRLATLFPIEIVSVDSVQIYRHLNVGSAKPSKIQREKVPHHLIDICDLHDNYSAAQFCLDVEKVLVNIRSRNKVPVFVGGTGLYFKSLLNGLSDLPSSDAALRLQLSADLNRVGVEVMHERLQGLDSSMAQRIHCRDTQRVLRALEVCILSQDSMTNLLRKPVSRRIALHPIKFVLYRRDRNALRNSLDDRFRKMLRAGLINEVLALKERQSLVNAPAAFKTIGYREVWGYLAGGLDYDQMLKKAVTASCQLAKRQTTWFRRESETIWCDTEHKDDLFAKLSNTIAATNIF